MAVKAEDILANRFELLKNKKDYKEAPCMKNQNEKIEVFKGLNRNIMPIKSRPLDFSVEEILYKGYTVIQNHITDKECEKLRAEIDALDIEDRKKWGSNTLKRMNDLGVLRNPFLRSELIAKTCFNRNAIEICKKIFKNQFIVHVNRAVINEPKISHSASVWHREPPYQNFITQEPLALSYILCIDASNIETGGVSILAGSHKWEKVPSDLYIKRNSVNLNIDSGGLLIINSALLHTSTLNKSKKRRSLVTIFTSPLIKQQTIIAKIISNNKNYQKNLSKIPDYKFLFGIETDPFLSDDDYRKNRLLLSKLDYS